MRTCTLEGSAASKRLATAAKQVAFDAIPIPHAVKDFASPANPIESIREALKRATKPFLSDKKRVPSRWKQMTHAFRSLRSWRIPFPPHRSPIGFDGKPLVAACMMETSASISFTSASMQMVLGEIPFTSTRFHESHAGSSFTAASSSLVPELIILLASVSCFDAAISSMPAEAISLAAASKEIGATIKEIASTSIGIASRAKEIDAESKEIDTGVKEIDADLEELHAVLQVARLDLTSLLPAASRSRHAGISIASGPYPRAPSME